MKVLLIGNGGREDALAYKLSESKSLTKLFIAPGNPGTSRFGTNIDIKVDEYEKILDFSLNNNIDLVVIGPEKPLVDGLADTLRSHKINVFGPSKAAAAIEGEKTFAKQLMLNTHVSTANYKEFNESEYEEAISYLSTVEYPCVVKADGLAAGKGVLICNDKDEAIEAINSMLLSKEFGDAGNKIIIEEFLEGEEASIFALTDGTDYVILPAAQDHKRIGNNDTGKNTGGMGAYAPAPIVDESVLKEVEKNIVVKILNGLKENGTPFVGCLYCGIIITKKGPYVIEFNCRFGDPETQAVMMLVEGDFAKLLYACSLGSIEKNIIKVKKGTAVCVVAASKGYPGSYNNGFEISGLEKVPETVKLFHSGTKISEDKLLTNGGRVLNVVSYNEDVNFSNTKKLAYDALLKIYFENIYFRTDISDKAINRS